MEYIYQQNSALLLKFLGRFYSSFFVLEQIDGSILGGLTQDDITNNLGVENAFHARKIVLHLDRLMEETLGPQARDQIPRV